MATQRPSTATGRRKGPKPAVAEPPPAPMREATRKAIEASPHLTAMDAGATEVLMVLAGRIDQIMSMPPELLAASKDNVTIPTYVKVCHELGLTPAGRAKFAQAKPQAAPGGSSLARRRAGVAAVKSA